MEWSRAEQREEESYRQCLVLKPVFNVLLKPISSYKKSFNSRCWKLSWIDFLWLLFCLFVGFCLFGWFGFREDFTLIRMFWKKYKTRLNFLIWYWFVSLDKGPSQALRGKGHLQNSSARACFSITPHSQSCWWMMLLSHVMWVYAFTELKEL